MSLWGLYIDPLYLAIFFLTLIVSIAAQIFLSSTYKKWSRIKNSAGLNGTQVGHQIINRTSLGYSGHVQTATVETPELKKLAALRDKGIVTDEEYLTKKKQIQASMRDTAANTSSIHFERTQGQLTDHYDPHTNTVRMSDAVAKQPSVASMAIVAHELGHAQQHEQNSIFISMRNFLLPAIRVSPTIAYLLILVGLIFNITGLFWLGILFYGVMVLFTLVTLPVEIDASRRGLKLLGEAGLMQTETDVNGSRRVLAAAASTYIAAAITAILQLLYYISIARRRR